MTTSEDMDCVSVLYSYAGSTGVCVRSLTDRTWSATVPLPNNVVQVALTPSGLVCKHVIDKHSNQVSLYTKKKKNA